MTDSETTSLGDMGADPGAGDSAAGDAAASRDHSADDTAPDQAVDEDENPISGSYPDAVDLLCSGWSLEECAHALDEAAGSNSVFDTFHRVREAFGVPIFGATAAVVPGNGVATAALLAWDYHVKISARPARRVSLEPREWVIDHHVPPQVRDVDEHTALLWRDLLPLVTAPVMRARLHHLLFQRGGSGARAHALHAVDAYIASAAAWTREMDAVDDLAAASRLARAVGDGGLVNRALNGLLDVTAAELAGGQPRFGIIARALDAALGEPGTPARIDELLDAAEHAAVGGLQKNQILAMSLTRARSAVERELVWERRVQAHIDQAGAEESAMLRSVRLHDALRTAEASGVKRLRRLPASRLEQVRDANTEMMRLEASSRLYEEQVERLVEDMSRGASWHESLVRFAHYPPLTGDTEANRGMVRHEYDLAPLSRLFPAQLYSPDGLPYLAGADEEERFDIDLAAVEQRNLSPMLRPLTLALMNVLHDQPPPPKSVLAGFLAQWPGVRNTAERLSDILLRFWVGDSDAAAYIAGPVIETVARELVDGTGVYITQRQQSPGQFPPLGGLIPFIAEEYDLDESRVRYLRTVLVSPAGLNVRNILAHGLAGPVGPAYAALLVHCALMLALVGKPTSPDGDATEGADAPDDGDAVPDRP